MDIESPIRSTRGSAGSSWTGSNAGSAQTPGAMMPVSAMHPNHPATSLFLIIDTSRTRLMLPGPPFLRMQGPLSCNDARLIGPLIGQPRMGSPIIRCALCYNGARTWETEHTDNAD